MTEAPEARPASTVVLLRDTPEGLQTLLLKRNKALLFAGGLWVFPGGAVDPEDMEAAGGNALLALDLKEIVFVRRAAVAWFRGIHFIWNTTRKSSMR